MNVIRNNYWLFIEFIKKTYSRLILDKLIILISNFRRVLNVVCFLLVNFPASEFYMPTFRNTLSVFLHRQVGMKDWIEKSWSN